MGRLEGCTLTLGHLPAGSPRGGRDDSRHMLTESNATLHKYFRQNGLSLAPTSKTGLGNAVPVKPLALPFEYG